jgi:NAD(P)-dependent dehydrogenase (short-subunit alcohol dehydrogenase family)
MFDINFSDMISDLSKKKVIIAGSEGLIGKALNKELVKIGVKVVGLDLKLGHDFSDEKTVKEIMQLYKKFDVLITPFALNPQPDEKSWDLFNLPLSSLEKYLKINLLALFSVCREFARVCNDNASIINFSSTYGVNSPKHFIYKEGFTKHIGYTITKSGVIGMTKYLATYLAPKIRVNAIVPGGIQNNQGKDFKENYSKMTPMTRMMNAEEIIGIILYLCSDISSYTTGSILTVDGGWTAW